MIDVKGAKHISRFCGNVKCDNHFRPQTARLTCSGCNYIKYCSSDCQLTHWPEHKLDCKKIAQLSDEDRRRLRFEQGSIMIIKSLYDINKEVIQRETLKFRNDKRVGGIFVTLPDKRSEEEALATPKFVWVDAHALNSSKSYLRKFRAFQHKYNIILGVIIHSSQVRYMCFEKK